MHFGDVVVWYDVKCSYSCRYPSMSTLFSGTLPPLFDSDGVSFGVLLRVPAVRVQEKKTRAKRRV